MVHLEKIGLKATDTVRQNRVKEKTEIPRKSERGTCVAVHDVNSNLNYITGMESKPVSILSTKYGLEPKVSMKRWTENEKKKQILFP